MTSTEPRSPITVSFRVFDDGDVIALWPEVSAPGLISSYMHVGQHSGASADLIKELRAATVEEKAALAAELRSIGYDVTDADLLETSEFLEFAGAYLECLKWSTSGNADGADVESLEEFAFSDSAHTKATADCAAFFTANHTDLIEAAAAYEEKGTNGDTGMAYAGHDFWLTRAGHGAGFWDGDLPEELGARLTEASKTAGHCEPYIGDDGYIYL